MGDRSSVLVQCAEKALPSSESWIVTLKDMKLEEARSYIKDDEDAAPNQLEYFNSPTEAFYEAYPELAESIFVHDEGSDHQSTTMAS